MGNGHSRRRRTDHRPPPPPFIPPPPPYPTFHPSYPRPLPHYHHQGAPYGNNGAMVGPVGPHFYQSGAFSNTWQYPVPTPPPASWPPLPPHQHAPPTAHVPESSSDLVSVEQQQTTTIRNDVNVKKATIVLEKDKENPGFHLVSFSLDAAVAGSVSIFFFAKEGANCCVTPVKPNIFKPVRLPFQKGFGQKVSQQPGTGVNLSDCDEMDLGKEGPDEVFPLVIRAETIPNDSAPESASKVVDGSIGAALPKSVNSQITHAIIEKKGNGDYKVRVLRQIIWVDGIRYELQEIYGIESSAGNGEYDDNGFGKECVICMSEPRDTTVLPCRHMCMCRDCAEVLRFKMDRCPICRQKVEKLMEIKVKS